MIKAKCHIQQVKDSGIVRAQPVSCIGLDNPIQTVVKDFLNFTKGLDIKDISLMAVWES